MDATKHNNNVLIPAFVIEINNCKNFNQLLHINWKIATKTKRLTNWYWFHVRIIGRKHSKEKNYITYNSALKMWKKGKYKLMYYFIYLAASWALLAALAIRILYSWEILPILFHSWEILAIVFHSWEIYVLYVSFLGNLCQFGN